MPQGSADRLARFQRGGGHEQRNPLGDELVLSGVGEMKDEILGAGAEADLRAPDAEAGGDVVAGMAAGMRTPRLFIHGIGDPVGGPDLAAMGMAAELEVDAGGFGFFQMERLMIQQDRKGLSVGHTRR